MTKVQALECVSILSPLFDQAENDGQYGFEYNLLMSLHFSRFILLGVAVTVAVAVLAIVLDPVAHLESDRCKIDEALIVWRR